MNHEYDLIAPFYDIEHAHFAEDLDMYHNFAELCGGKILELACGSGRVMLSLADEGYEITGIDNSSEMLNIAREALTEAGVAARCTLLEQDLCDFHVEQKFRLAIIALGSFAHITKRKDQQRALAAVRAHMSPGGTFIVDISNGDARYMENLSGQVLHQGTWQDDEGNYFTHFVSPASATHTHQLELTHFYDRHVQGGNVERTVVTTQLYLFERSEMELLLEQAGFVVKNVYGDHDLGPYHIESPRMIFIAEAR
ncbi:class I SAM-dependent DNA methyltransferase [Dictyobacter arantiisoli]|uniref:Type 12 methyltransferase n=1 Tax=Dictyobacter arantiisoli TaxID=2014874 RepID=A0A5A5TLE5_9CHLR|nr:class I SAM-dependent methyltransferase [Dictyobacter arantiisoli]GCF11913.1 type 12 methyltransferase [Dictyobacter arantiisoli]